MCVCGEYIEAKGRESAIFCGGREGRKEWGGRKEGWEAKVQNEWECSLCSDRVEFMCICFLVGVVIEVGELSVLRGWELGIVS